MSRLSELQEKYAEVLELDPKPWLSLNDSYQHFHSRWYGAAELEAASCHFHPREGYIQEWREYEQAARLAGQIS